MKLSIIIVSYNVSSYLRQCLLSIYQSNQFGSFEVIVVDNYSHDDSCQMVINQFPKVRLIVNNENLGFSKAVNIGLNKSNSDFVCILNPDSLVSDNTFKVLLDYITKHHNIGCIGPKILNPDGSLQLACKRSFPNLFSALFKLTGISRLFPRSHFFGEYNLMFSENNRNLFS